MCKYKHSLTKIETFYMVAFLNGTNYRFVFFLFFFLLGTKMYKLVFAVYQE